MTVRDYITQRFKSFSVSLTDADIYDMCKGEETNELTELNADKVNVEIANFIPTLLLHPSSVSESGFSVSFDKSSLREYYNYLCARYGLRNLLNADKPKIRIF